jgi:predicted DNA-binding WGR domain protein
MTTPTTPPDERRMFQLTDLGNNNNKYWQAEVWERPGADPLVRVTFGRVGAKPPKNAEAKPMSRAELGRLIRSKEAKGYREVMLTASGAISLSQIAEGRALLRLAQREYEASDWPSLIKSIERYCTTIPTQLPAQIDPQDVARMFAVNMAAQLSRLDQLAVAAGAPAPATAAVPAPSPAQQPRRMQPLPTTSDRSDRLQSTSGIDWSTLWLTSADAARMERDGVALPVGLALDTGTQRDARSSDDIDLASLGIIDLPREARST